MIFSCEYLTTDGTDITDTEANHAEGTRLCR